jgi:6-phosphogluconolactonase (cycloisomerase 2 family)
VLPRSFFSPWIAAGLLVLGSAPDASAQKGSLTQLEGLDACISDDGSSGECVDGKGLGSPEVIAITKDGKHVYVAAGSAVAVLARNKKTGALSQLEGTAGCLSENGSGGDCVDAKRISNALGVAVSRDGKHVYVAGFSSDAVAVFARNKKTGALTQLEGTDACVSRTGSGGDCIAGRGLDGPNGVAVTKDGKHVYATSTFADAIAVFARNKKTGALTQPEGTDACVSETGTSGDCADGKSLAEPRSVAVSQDGKHVYVASRQSGAVAVFARNKKTGALTQLEGTAGCVSEDGTFGDCTEGKGLNQARSVAVSRDGKHVYVASSFSDAVAIFARNKKTGALTQLDGIAGCVSEDGTSGECTDGKGLASATSVAVSKDGKHVYVASFGSHAVAIFARQKKK